MTKNRIKRKKTGIIWLIFTLVWMVVIFSFSAREADESAAMSHSVGKMIGRLVIPEYRSWSEDKQGQFAEKIDFPERMNSISCSCRAGAASSETYVLTVPVC